ncbi:MAG: glycosyltransferase [Deltaproteobacteria bacterium]|nr:MAG: glycosyltransferase [Deltaproteobacteria bacterium]
MTRNKIKIVHLITSFWANHGPSSALLTQIRSHDPGEFAFSIWSLYAPPPAQDPRDLLLRNGIEHRVLPMSASFLDVRVLTPLVRLLRRERPDILHCHLLRANLYGRFAGRLAGVAKIVNTIHGVDEYMVRGDFTSRSLRLAERLSAPLVSRYVAVSENARQAVVERLKIPPGRVSTILNALDLDPFRQPEAGRRALRAELGLSPDAVVIGSVGRLAPLKNLAFLIEQMKELAVSFPQAELVIIGEGPERPALENLIAALNLGDKVRLPGFRADIPRMLPALDLFAFPSLSEGLSIALLEAMAAGLPCVVMDVGGNGEAVAHGHTGYVVPYGDSSAFASALSHLLKDASLRKKLGTAGKNRAFTLFNPQRLATQYEELYFSLLNRRP